MKRVYRRALAVARNPVVRPLEVWALRTLLAAVCAKVGIDLAAIAR